MARASTLNTHVRVRREQIAVYDEIKTCTEAGFITQEKQLRCRLAALRDIKATLDTELDNSLALRIDQLEKTLLKL